MSNFDFIATYVDLSDSPTYTTNITLEGQLLKISFVWNERIGKRTIFIRNSADVCYLQNTILHPNESFELNSNAVFDDLPYKVVLQKVGDTNKVGNIYKWSKDFILCFYRTVDVETEKLNVKYGITTPSTPTLPTTPSEPTCSPTETSGVNLLSDNYPNKTIEYKLNDGQFYQIQVENFGEYLTTALFSSIIYHSGFDALFTEGGFGYFGVKIESQNFTVFGSDGLSGFESNTVVIKDVTGNNIIQSMFGESEITIHSCGFQTFFE